MRRRVFLAGVSALALLAAGAARAADLPTGGKVAAGAASIQTGAGQVQVKQTSDRAIVNWQSFGIGQGKSVVFNQPSQTSAILNRVTGSEVSNIAGTLSANGQVFLINPNGMIFAPTGKVLANGGFVGSTLDIRDSDFMAGRLKFSGTGGAIYNRGSIITGRSAAVALLAGAVSNDGLIQAPLGKVMIGSGLQATLDLSGEGYLQVALPASLLDDPSQALVSNSGTIRADGGHVVMRVATAREVVREAVNTTGLISAKGLSGHDGSITLDGGDGGRSTVSGTLTVDGPIDGGRIDLTSGASLSVTGATLSARGGEQGGLVRIGGEFQGGQPRSTTAASIRALYTGRFGALPTLSATDTVTFDGASLVDVTGGRSGGSVVLWSNLKTVQSGAIQANGGAVEVSSKGHLHTSLPNITVGKTGTLLLDPTNIFIGDTDGSATTLTGSVAYADNSGNDDHFLTSDLMALVDAGADIVLQASNNITWHTGNVFDTAVSPGSITLNAGAAVTLQGNFSFGRVKLNIVSNDTAAHGVDSTYRTPNLFGDIAISGDSTFIASTSDINLTIGTGAGDANERVGDIRMENMFAGNLTMTTAGVSSSHILFISSFGVASDSNVTETVVGALTMTGPLKSASTGALWTISANSINWTDEATAKFSGNTGTALTLIQNGTIVGLGFEGIGGTANKLALGAGGSSPQYTSVYGDVIPSTTQLHLIGSSTIQSGDDITTLLQSGSTSVSGLPAANSHAGNYTVTTSPASPVLNATLSGDYFIDLRPVAETLQITPKSLTPTITNGAYTYGSPDPVVTLSGVINSDTVAPVATLDSTTGVTLAANGPGFGFGAFISAGSHNFTLTGVTNSDYQLAAGTWSGTLSIARKPINYTIFDATSTYGTVATPGSFLTGVVNSDDVSLVVSSTGLSTTKGVGTYPLTGGSLGGGQGGNYSIAGSGNTDATLTIGPKSLTYTSTGGSSTYGTLLTLATPVLAGLINSDSVTVAPELLQGSTPVTVSATTSAGSYSVGAAISGPAVANYVLASSGNTVGAWTINPKPLTFSVSDASQTYGSMSPLVTVTGVLNGDSVSYQAKVDGSPTGLQSVTATTFGVDAFTAAGSHSIMFDGFSSGGANYSLDLSSANRNATLTVDRKTVTYSINNTTATYGFSSGLPTVTLNGFLGFGALSLAETATNSHGVTTTLSTTAMPADTYAITAGTTLTGTAAGNYVLASSGNTNATRTVSPDPLIYTTFAASSTYGSQASLGSAFFTTVNGDAISATLGLQTFGGSPVALSSTTPAGSYKIVITSLGGAAAGNYILSNTNTIALLTVAQKTVSYSLGSATSTYGTLADPLLTLNGAVSGDDVSGVVLAGGQALTATTTASSYFTSVNALSGTAAGNYLLASSGNTNGHLVINPKTITYSIADSQATYGDGIVFGGVTFNGLVGGDAAPLTRMSLPQTTSPSPNAGGYTEQVTLFASNDYVLASSGNSQGTFTVTKRPLTISGIVLPFAGGGLTYGVKPGDLSTQVTLGNTIPGDVVVGGLTTPSLPLSTGGYIKVGSYTFPVGASLTGPSAGNYSVDVSGSTAGTLTINPKALTAGAIPVANNVYGSTLTTGSATFGGILSGDAVQGQGVALFSGSTLVTPGPKTPAGSYTASATGIIGTDSANYAFSAGGGTAVTIFPKALSWSISAGTGVYGGTPTLGAATLTGIVGSDQVAGTVGLAGGGTLSSQMNVGAYGQTVAGLTGAAASNYAVGSGSDAGLKITPKVLGFTIGNQSLTYGDDESNVPNVVQLTGVLPGDSVSTILSLFPTSGPSFAAGNRTFAFTNLGGAVTVNDGRGNLTPYVLPAATYDVDFTSLAGNSSLNYSFSRAQDATLTTLTVNQRPLTYTVTGGGTTAFGTVLQPTSVAFANTAAQTPTYHYVATNGSGGTQYDTSTASSLLTPVGGYTLGVALNADSYNYVLASSGNVTPALTITRKPITLNLKTISDTYGDAINDLVDTTGLVSGDTTAPTVKLNGATITLASTSSGFGLSSLLDAGAYTYSFQGLSGAGATNYTVTTAGTPAIAVAQKAITWSLAPVTLQYGGTTSPDTLSFCGGAGAGSQDCASDITPGAVGKATLTGVLASDAANVSPKVQINDGTKVFDYAAQTPAGAYAEIVTSLTGTRASNYVLASTANTAGLLTIQPAWLYAAVSSGGRILNGAENAYQVVGDPGEVTFQHFVAFTPNSGSNLVSGLFPGDSVTGLVAVYDSGGNPVADATKLAVGDYQIRVVTLSGSSAANYRLAPLSGLKAGFGQYTGSTPGDLNVVDVSLFNFSFLTSDPNNAGYTPPAAVTKPNLLSIGTGASTGVAGSATASAGIAGVDASATASGGTSASASVGLTGGRATVGASGNASATVSAGAASVSVDANASTTALAKFGVTGVTVSANAQTGASVTVAVGPVSQSYGASASASSSNTISLSQNPTITLKNIATVGANDTTAVSGALGGGVSGSASQSNAVFAEARSNTTIGYSNGQLKIGEDEFVGVGASTGVSGSVSGGGVTGSASVTVYSPGSLGLGAQSTSGISNGVVTIGFSLGVSIGIGGLQIAPSFSFQTAALVSAGETMIAGIDKLTGVNTNVDPCAGSSACYAIQNKNTAIAMLKAKGPTMELMSFLQQHPDAIQSASQLNGLPDNAALLAANRTYGSIPATLTSVVQQEQALAQKMKANPASLTPADLQQAQNLRAQEATLVAETQTLGGKLQVANGQISLVKK